jgi:hypothetical protein
MNYKVVQGTVVVMNIGDPPMSAVVCICVSAAVAEAIVRGLNLVMATDMINGV